MVSRGAAVRSDIEVQNVHKILIGEDKGRSYKTSRSHTRGSFVTGTTAYQRYLAFCEEGRKEGSSVHGKKKYAAGHVDQLLRKAAGPQQKLPAHALDLMSRVPEVVQGRGGESRERASGAPEARRGQQV